MTRSSYNCIAPHKSIVKTKKGIFYKTNSANCSWLSYHSKANVRATQLRKLLLFFATLDEHHNKPDNDDDCGEREQPVDNPCG